MSLSKLPTGTASLEEIVTYADLVMQSSSFQDYPGAYNGLQFENSGLVTKIAAAVDGSFTTIRKAAAEGARLLIVHHGLFWGNTVPWTGRRAEMLRFLIQADLAVYSQHLPLDAHADFGNASRLAQALGFDRTEPFFECQGSFVGVKTHLREPVTREAMASNLARVLGHPPILVPGGRPDCHRIGICTGSGGSELAKAAASGVDTFITGEGPHWSYALAEDLGINVFYGGHYATETFGVKALTEHLAQRFEVPWTFIDHPTGL